MTRVDWDNYFMKMCDLVSSRSTCDRKNVGTVIVKDKRVISTGYNGSLSGLPHCCDPTSFYECPKCSWKSKATENLNEFMHCEECYQKLTKVNIKHGGHDMKDGHCIRTAHAESNAIAQAARLGISTENATIYCNTRPCFSCLKLIVGAGIKTIVYRDDYRASSNDRVSKTAKELKDLIEMRKLSNPIKKATFTF